MSNFITIGKGLVPPEHIALVEMFDPAANPRFRPKREFQARVVLLNRESILIEEKVQDFASEHGFRMIEEDSVATNPAVHFRVETFTPADGFNPTKPYRTRIRWRDLDGNDQSKLLLTKAVSVVAIAVKGEAAAEAAGPDPTAAHANAAKRTARRKQRAATPAPEKV